MDLGQHLMQYATEANDGTVVTPVETPTNELNDAGATELTVVTDDVASTLEEELTDLAEDVQKLNSSNAAAQKLVDATESLESMIMNLESLEARGIPLDNTAANMFLQGVALSLECREIPKDLFEQDLMQAQASFEANQLALPNPAASGGEGDNTKDAKGKTSNILSRLWAVLKNAVMGAIERLRNFVARMGKSASAIKASGAKLKEVGKKVSGPATGKLKSSSFTALAIGGKIDANSTLHEVETGWGWVLEITKDLREVSKKLIDAISKPDSGTIGAFARTIDTRLKKVDHELTGGWRCKFIPGEGGGFDGVLKAKFEIKRGEKPSPGQAEFEPLSGSEIVALGGRLEAIGTLMEKIAADSNESVRQANAVIEAAKRGVDKGDDKVEAGEAQKLFSTAQKLVSQISSFAPAYVEYMGATAKQAYSLGIASAGKHKGGESATPEKKDEGTKAVGQEKQAQIGNDKGDDKK